MLLDIIPTEEVGHLVIGGTAVVCRRTSTYCTRGVLVKLGRFTAFYVSTKSPAVGVSEAEKRLLSVTYSSVNAYCYNTPTVYDTLFNLFLPNPGWKVRAWKGRLPEYEKAKITGMHHTHIRPRDVLEMSIRTGSRRMQLLREVVTKLWQLEINIEASVATVLLFTYLVDHTFCWLFVKSEFLWRGERGIEAFAGRLKQLSAQIKSVHTANYEPLTELFELSVLVNRGIGEVDWVGERSNRTKPDVVRVDQRKLYAKVREMFEHAKEDYRYPTMDIDKYIKTRWEWIPGGSVHSQYPSDDNFVVPGLYTRNKFVTVNKMPDVYLRELMTNSTPEVRAWTSTKYEWAKQRAIYGTDLRSTLITNFAMYRCEEVLKHKFPVGEQAEASVVHKRIKSMLDNGESFCFDYDDFNSQHSIASMHSVLLAFKDTFEVDMSDDQQSAMEWVCQSVKNMYALDPGTREWYKLNGTLLSGWRLTTFMNTVLNWAYMELAGAFDHGDVQDSVHNGDDVMLSVTSVDAAIHVMDAMRGINARAQEAKCNLFTVREFLRVEHGISGDSGLGAQYLTRACATSVHSRIESNAPISLTRLVEADRTRTAELFSRVKADDVRAEYERVLDRRAARVFHTTVTTVDEVKRLHRVVGGINPNRWAPVDKKVVFRDTRYEIPTELNDINQWPGISDYSRYIWNKLEQKVDFTKVYDAVLSGSKLTVAMKRDAHMAIEVNDDTNTSSWERAMYKTYKSAAVTYFTSLTKFMSIPPLANIEWGTGKYAVMSALASDDPIRALHILL